MSAVAAMPGISGGFYVGFVTTVSRELPFSAVQFPLYEYFKRTWSERQGRPVSVVQAALCGAAAGCVVGAITTPLDVTKTRLTLGQDQRSGMLQMM